LPAAAADQAAALTIITMIITVMATAAPGIAQMLSTIRLIIGQNHRQPAGRQSLSSCRHDPSPDRRQLLGRRQGGKYIF